MNHLSRTPRRRTVGALIAAAAVALTMAATPAAASAADGDTGWLRLGHLSPDTKSVDVQVASLSGGATLFELKGVGRPRVDGAGHLGRRHDRCHERHDRRRLRSLRRPGGQGDRRRSGAAVCG